MKKEVDSKPPIRNLKFAPKAPPRKKPVVKSEPKKEIKSEPIDTELFKHLSTAKSNAAFSRGMPKSERKVNEQVSLGATTSYTTFGASGPSTGSFFPKVDKIKEYKEPWDYEMNHPITLPLRERGLGDPQTLDEEEFGGTTASLFATGTELDPASKLGLTVKSDNSRMIFFQLPLTLPLPKPDLDPKPDSNPKLDSHPKSEKKIQKKGYKISELPGGYMGKLLVYKSGKVKMKLGENFFDVYPGSDCKFSQDLVVVNVKEMHCCVIGQVGEERAIVVPDIDCMLGSLEMETK